MRTSKKKASSLHNERIRRFLAVCAVVLVLATSLLAYTSAQLSGIPRPVAAAQEDMARSVYRLATEASTHPFEGAPELTNWKWQGDVSLPGPDFLQARSVLVTGTRTGEVLYEKNADERIPPASMTKLVAIYTALRAVKTGEVSLQDRVLLPEECWAQNIPPGSSLMFLGPGQTVTLDEILTGMAVVSGNDAAIALAYHISGSVPEFVNRMNNEMHRIGLRNTVFAEPSGLSEENLTTAREFASFALQYIREFPEALVRYHAKREFSYPKTENLLPGYTEQTISQQATNTLLTTLPGCDGLKTGFIYESGFNICLTAERDDIRFVAVLMGGPGNTIREGVRIRNKDGVSIMEWVFANRRLHPAAECIPVPLTVWGGTGNGLWAIPAESGAFTVPSGVILESQTRIPRWITAPVAAGEEIGVVQYYVAGKTVYSVPLIADRNVGSASFPQRLLDAAALLAADLLVSNGYHSEQEYQP